MELKNLVLTEKYRPTTFDELIFAEKDKLLGYLKNPKALPSFIFYSSKPGTGKTSTAKIVISYLSCDYLILNSSEERGIDTIRDKINMFVRGMSSNENAKRCVFLDEADGLTKQAQDSLKNLMETYADNCFFILSCNDLSKIIEPIRSRCVSFSFSKPDKTAIRKRLEYIAKQEGITLSSEETAKISDLRHPDIRLMIRDVWTKKIDARYLATQATALSEALCHLKSKDIEYFKQKIYSQELDLFEFNNYLFMYLLENHKVIGLEKASKIAFILADNEKCWQQGCNQEIIFFSNLLEVMKIW
jgi:DNA polymerase III delta prime subunit